MYARVGTWASVLVVVLLVTACGDAPFSQLGKVDEWVDEGAAESEAGDTVETTVVLDGPMTLDRVTWFNGWAPAVAEDPDTMVANVWARTDGLDAYVQSSPNEIAAALPGIMVPGVFPDGVEAVTSQLVFGRTNGNLTNFFVAAFGFWLLEPYTASSQVGQAATLKVAFEQEEARDITDPTGGCARFADRDVTGCDPFDINGHPAWWIVSLDGENLVLLQGDYRYEFTIRPQIDREAVEAMAESMVPLSSATPSEATLAVEPVGATTTTGASVPDAESSG